jgi:cadmium resistance protein CadD (predicted permease)
MGVVFAIVTAIWIAFAIWLTGHRAIGAPIRRYSQVQVLMPLLFIALGLFILYKAGTATLFFKR